MATVRRNNPTDERQGGARIGFGNILMDVRAGRLLRGDTVVALRPKTWAVLEYLVTRPGVLVGRDELLEAVWPGVAVTPDTLTKSIGELRVALGDDRRVPRFVETVPRRGFRFVAPTRVEILPEPTRAPAGRVMSGVVEQGPGPFVGRAAELRQLTEIFGRAEAGYRQTVFVTGPAGIGKTALIAAFLNSAPVRDADPPVWVARGLCLKQHGPREPYLPVLDAIERLARQSEARRLISVLRRVAPSWLAQIPWMLTRSERARLRRSLQDARAARALREFGALSEALAGQRTLILVLEDLQWSDAPTIDLVSFLAQRPDPARLLVICTVRVEDAEVHGEFLQPAMRALAVHRHCAELPLADLSEGEVRSYLVARFAGSTLPPESAALVRERSGGNPLFMEAVVDELVARGWIVATAAGWMLAAAVERCDLGIPMEMQHVIEMQFRSLNEADRGLLEVASVAGREFTTAVIAAALGAEPAGTESRLHALARAQRFMRSAGDGELPGGIFSARYAFMHDVHREVVYAQIPAARRQQLHQRVAESLEAASEADEMASELAAHFRLGGDVPRAVHYLGAAAERARERFADREAAGYLETALALLPRLRDHAERRRRELDLRLALAPVLSDLSGFASEQLRENCERARTLCVEVGTPEQLFRLVFAQCHVYGLRADPVRAPAVIAELNELAQRSGSTEQRLVADTILARSALMHGRYAETCRIADGVGRQRAQVDLARLPFDVVHAVTDTRFHHAFALWWLGQVDRAKATMREAVGEAGVTGRVFSQVVALCHGGLFALLCRRPDEVRDAADKALVLCTEQGFRFYEAMATALGGWARVQSGELEGGIEELLRARAVLSATDARVFSTHILAYLAEAYWRAGDCDAGLTAVEEGLGVAESTLERTYWPELWRLKGELLLAAAVPRLRPRTAGAPRTSAAAREARQHEAERCLTRALEVAREYEALSLELRAATSLARAWHQCGRDADARAVLAGAYGRFDPGDDSPDLAEARTLLRSLSTAA